MTIQLDENLDLSKAPATLFFFGLAGSGKSFVGDIIGQLAHWHVYHADDDLTDEMQLALDEQRAFTNSIRDRYFKLIGAKILALQSKHNKLIVTQGVYKQQHRDYLMTQVPNMEMIWVDAPATLIIERINRRHHGIKIQSAAALRADFDLPPQGVKTIINDNDALHIVQQLNQFYGKAT